MDAQLIVVLLCLAAAVLFMGLRFWRVWMRKCSCACTSEKPDPDSPTCAACLQNGKLQDFRERRE